MHHSCPHHGDALVRKRIDANDTWRCQRCEGVWLPGAVVAKVVGASPRWPDRSDTRATELLCPDDGTHLRAVDADGIELDLCPHCHGLWLDRGELEDILRRARRDATSDEIDELVEELVDHAAEAVDDALSSPRRVPVRKDIDGDAPLPWKPLPLSQHGASPRSSMGTPPQSDPASAGVFDVELDPGTATFDVEAVADGTDLLGSAADVAGEAIAAVFEFIGGVFSGL